MRFPKMIARLMAPGVIVFGAAMMGIGMSKNDPEANERAEWAKILTWAKEEGKVPMTFQTYNDAEGWKKVLDKTKDQSKKTTWQENRTWCIGVLNQKIQENESKEDVNEKSKIANEQCFTLKN